MAALIARSSALARPLHHHATTLGPVVASRGLAMKLNAPRKTKTAGAFALFCLDNLAQVQDVLRTPRTSLSKLSEMWSELDDDAKVEYNARARIPPKGDFFYSFANVTSSLKNAAEDAKVNLISKAEERKNKPRKVSAPSSFILYTKDRMKELLPANKDKKVTELIKVIAQEWKTLDPAIKNKYIEKHKASKEALAKQAGADNHQ